MDGVESYAMGKPERGVDDVDGTLVAGSEAPVTWQAGLQSLVSLWMDGVC